MGNLLSISEVGASWALHASEILLLVGGFVLVVGLIGEYRDWKRPKLWELLVIVGVSVELLADGGVFIFSEQLQSIANDKVAGLNNATLRMGGDIVKQQERAGKLEVQAAELTARNLQLEGAMQPRRLTGTQKARLLKLLEGHRDKIAVVSRFNDTESSDFADDLFAALHDAKWEPMRIWNRLSSKRGVSLGTTAGTAFTTSAKALDAALTEIGITHDNPAFTVGDASTNPPFQAGLLYLVIEEKPSSVISAPVSKQ